MRITPIRLRRPSSRTAKASIAGASLKDLGRKCFAFTKLDAGAIRGIKKSAFRPTQ